MQFVDPRKVITVFRCSICKYKGRDIEQVEIMNNDQLLYNKPPKCTHCDWPMYEAKTVLIEDLPYRTEPYDKIGDIMSLDDFIEACEGHMFIDYDGHGYYAVSPEELTDILVVPSDIMKGLIDRRFKYVSWYNK